MEGSVLAAVGTVAAAAVTALGGIGVALVQRAERSAQASEKVLEKLQTNHGLEPWEYLEMVAQVRDEVVATNKTLASYVRLNERAHESLHLRLDEQSTRLEALEATA